MPTLTLDRMWINKLTTGASVSAFSAIGRAFRYTDIGEVKQLAGGRQRSVHTVGEQGEFPFTLLDVSRANRDVLRTWKGETLQFRTDRGDIFIGAYFTVPAVEVRDKRGFYDIALTVRGVTADEGV